MKVETLHTIDTEQPADSIEWCTHPDYPHHFICGTYHLEEGQTDISQAPTRKKKKKERNNALYESTVINKIN